MPTRSNPGPWIALAAAALAAVAVWHYYPRPQAPATTAAPALPAAGGIL